MDADERSECSFICLPVNQDVVVEKVGQVFSFRWLIPLLLFLTVVPFYRSRANKQKIQRISI